MTDTYGDGWNGAYWTWTDGEGESEYGTMDDGDSDTAQLCGYGCHTFEVGDGGYPDEIEWIIESSSGEVEAQGYADESISVCVWDDDAADDDEADDGAEDDGAGEGTCPASMHLRLH